MGDPDGEPGRPRFGWFAHPPQEPRDHVDPPVRDVHLRVDEYAGPFWTTTFALGDDFDELHEALGLSRALYDDVMAWHARSVTAGADTDSSFHDQQNLLRRLADEVGPGIAVPAPQDEPPKVVALAGTDTDRLPLPAELRDAVMAWRAQGEELRHATVNNDEAIFAWEDAGVALARDVGEALGPGYVVQFR